MEHEKYLLHAQLRFTKYLGVILRMFMLLFFLLKIHDQLILSESQQWGKDTHTHPSQPKLFSVVAKLPKFKSWLLPLLVCAQVNRSMTQFHL